MGLVADAYAFLVAQNIVEGSTGWKLRRRRLDETANQLVVLTEDGGDVPEIATVEGIGDAALKDVGLHVIVRGEPWDGDGSFTKAQEIHSLLHGQLGVTMGANFYHRLQARTAEPLFAGYDERGRPTHSISFLGLTDAKEMSL